MILSIGANVGVAGLASVGAWQQNRTARHAVDAEAVRAGAARDEEHLRHRQSIYHNHLDAVRALNSVMVTPKFSESAVLNWRATYEHSLNAVVLFGTDAARAAVDELHAVILRLTVDDAGAALDTNQAIHDRFWSLTDEIATGFRAAIKAMRTDVAPEEPR